MKQSPKLDEYKNIDSGLNKMNELFDRELRKAYSRGYVNGRASIIKEGRMEAISLENENIKLKNELLKKQLIK